MPSITIVNKYKAGKRGQFRIYVGRPSALGNPYPLYSEKDRATVILNYEKWFNQQIIDENPEVIEALEDLKEILVEGNNLQLECYCAPKACHASIIKEYLEYFLTRHNQRKG